MKQMIFTVIILGGIAFVLGLSHRSVVEQEYRNCMQTDRYDLKALKDTTRQYASIDGSSFIFFGSIHGEMGVKDIYQVYRSDSIGYVMQQLPVSITTIVEDEPSKPYLVRNKIFGDDLSGTRRRLIEKEGTDYGEFCAGGIITYHYELHIPSDSIISTYRLDMEK